MSAGYLQQQQQQHQCNTKCIQGSRVCSVIFTKATARSSSSRVAIINHDKSLFSIVTQVVVVGVVAARRI
jgi:hypothetical protein